MEPIGFLALVAACAPLVDPGTARALVAVESGFNPNAIGVVGGALERQPRSTREALTTSNALRQQGWNYSVGLAQINVRNFARLGLTTATAFEPCANLTAMQILLADCFARASARAGSAQQSLRRALSCYYSGNFVTGFAHGYVDRVVRAALPPPQRVIPSLHFIKETS